MNTEQIIEIVAKALKNIDSSRFFKTERGFQGRFVCVLYEILDAEGLFPEDAILEEEYQKRIGNYGTSQRPDLIIHVPVESTHSSDRTENNFVVFEFKKQADENKAKGDFKKLDKIFRELKYPLGIFVNINGSKFFLDGYSGQFENRIHEFCVTQTNDKSNILHAHV